VNVDKSQAATVQTLTLDEKEHLIIRHLCNARKIAKQGQNLPAVPQVSTSQLADNERVHHDFDIFQQARQPCLAGAEVVDPHRCVDQDHSGSAAARRSFGVLLGATQSREPSGTHLGDESLETEVYERRLFLNARESGGFGENLFIQDQCRSHAY
jgi:hypothetical protein